jgi:hypothetical protein
MCDVQAQMMALSNCGLVVNSVSGSGIDFGSNDGTYGVIPLTPLQNDVIWHFKKGTSFQPSRGKGSSTNASCKKSGWNTFLFILLLILLIGTMVLLFRAMKRGQQTFRSLFKSTSAASTPVDAGSPGRR